MKPAFAVALVALLVSTPGEGRAGDPYRDARLGGLSRDLAGARMRLHASPRRSAHAVDRVEARLRSLAIRPSEATPRVERIERELTDLRHDADRVAGRRALLRTAGRVRPVPEAARPPYPEDMRGIERPIGVGKLVVLVQRSLRSSARELAAARHGAAARHLARAEGDLARLGRFGEDPMLRALHGEAADIRLRLGGR